jgi:hypothetical protein
MLNGRYVFVTAACAGAAAVCLASLLASAGAAQASRAELPYDAGAPTAPGTSVKGTKLKVSPNGRYFVDQDGKPFFYLGDTIWLLFQRMNHAEVDEYLKDRAGKGFTVVQAYVLRGLEARHPDGTTSLIGETPLIGRDPTRAW